jgi:5-methylcytosine-specific restriction endonuclease McrA
MAALNPGRVGRPWRRLCAQVYAEETHCWLCHQYVDMTLPHNHKRSRSVDHVVELHQGGDPLDRRNLRLAHRDCNTRKSNRLRGHQPRQQIALDASTL